MASLNLTYPEEESFLQVNIVNNATLSMNMMMNNATSSSECFENTNGSILLPPQCNFSLICVNGTFVDGECFVSLLVILLLLIIILILLIIVIVIFFISDQQNLDFQKI